MSQLLELEAMMDDVAVGADDPTKAPPEVPDVLLRVSRYDVAERQ